ncbi:MAG: DeoR/GlpR family DNA-binding transcription regulator [Anaerolineales bacterium]|nr:DeoR/GlpR family DNA-binding transcription regulator [Anaerolineales bacterium]
MAEQLNAQKRRELISTYIRDQTQVKVIDLMEEFGLTDTSIRRDLSILEGKGILRRVHGGAVSTSEGLQIMDFEDRSSNYGLEKRLIGAFAANTIQSKDVILLDSGTTVLQVAKHIPNSIRQMGTLRIVTNSTLLLDEVGLWASPNLVLLGGIYLPEHRATVGPEVLESLQQITAQRVFLGCDGLSIDGGITTAHPLIAEAGRAMASRADQVIVLADHSKLGRAGFVPIMPIERIDVIITDPSAPEGILTELRDSGIQVLVAS